MHEMKIWCKIVRKKKQEINELFCLLTWAVRRWNAFSSANKCYLHNLHIAWCVDDITLHTCSMFACWKPIQWFLVNAVTSCIALVTSIRLLTLSQQFRTRIGMWMWTMRIRWSAMVSHLYCYTALSLRAYCTGVIHMLKLDETNITQLYSSEVSMWMWMVTLLSRHPVSVCIVYSVQCTHYTHCTHYSHERDGKREADVWMEHTCDNIHMLCWMLMLTIIWVRITLWQM